jgi:hypothetical protein
MSSNRRQPATVPPAAAIRPGVSLPVGPFWKLPLAATVSIVMVVVPVPPAVKTMFAVVAPVAPNS